jgi:hypothetical protein
MARTREMLYCWLLAAITQVHRVYWAKFRVRFDAVAVEVGSDVLV